MTSVEGCFSCGATQVDLAPRDLASPRNHGTVPLCPDCAKTFAEAGLLAPRRPTDFASRLTAASLPPLPVPGSPSTG